MTYRLVTYHHEFGRGGLAWRIRDFGTERELISTLKILNYPQTGIETSERLRPELIGHPTFMGLNGPCWGGEENGEPVIRYETVEAYRELSA